MLEEVESAVAAGAVIVDLGPTILRVETAAVSMAAALRARPAG
jgi:16S rRNA U1498 N3-methylase RsmE